MPHPSIQSLLEFINTDKFKTYGHLQPAVENSTEADKQLIEERINACCRQLLTHLEAEQPDKDAMKSIINDSMEAMREEELDTEDLEFAFELYYKIGEITGIEIQDPGIPGEENILADLQRLAAKAGIDLSQFLPPGNR